MTERGFSWSCPVPIGVRDHVALAHGGGGSVMRGLIQNVFMAAFDNPYLRAEHDAAALELAGARIAFTTDSYVVRPLFFPGGDIGSLAVYGTVNDLAMAGARPLYLSAGFILEEGFPLAELERIAASMQAAAAAAGVQIVTGDTKVVDRGKGDGVFINTAGVGVIPEGREVSPSRIRPGDRIVVSGDLGRHGIAIMAAREGLEFETVVESDSASVWPLVKALFNAGVDVHCLRDLTRGGLTSALNEIASAAGHAIAIEEAAVPVREDVHSACEMLGFDPLYVANEGRFVAFVPEQDAAKTVEILRRHGENAQAALIGAVEAAPAGPAVTLLSRIGGRRVLDMLTGEQLPRIC